MSEASSEKAALKPIDAHPELPIIPGTPPPIERFQRYAQDHPPATRRAVLSAAGLSAAAAILGVDRIASTLRSNTTDSIRTREHYEDVSRMPDGHLEVGVAQYLTPDEITFRAQKGADTLKKYEEPTIHVRTKADSNADDFPTNPAALNNLDIGLRRVLSDHSNQYYTDSSQRIKSGDTYRYVWYELGRLDEDGNWITVDTNGKPTDTPLYISPTGLDIELKPDND